MENETISRRGLYVHLDPSKKHCRIRSSLEPRTFKSGTIFFVLVLAKIKTLCKRSEVDQPWWKKWCKFRRPLQQGISKVQSMPNSRVNCNKKRSKQLTQLFILINLMDSFVSLQRKTSTMFHNKWASLFPRWVALKGGLRTGELSNFPVFGKCASFCGPFLISKILVKAVTRT